MVVVEPRRDIIIFRVVVERAHDDGAAAGVDEDAAVAGGRAEEDAAAALGRGRARAAPRQRRGGRRAHLE